MFIRDGKRNQICNKCKAEGYVEGHKKRIKTERLKKIEELNRV